MDWNDVLDNPLYFLVMLTGAIALVWILLGHPGDNHGPRAPLTPAQLQAAQAIDWTDVAYPNEL